VSVVRIATRGSELALAQARHIAGRIERALRTSTELVVIRTTGDRILDRPLAAIGGKGLFVKEIEEALLACKADIAVHSAKDLPARTPEGLTLACWPERADPRDALAARVRGMTLATLPHAARIGTGSVRRAAQLRAFRPDLVIVALRGNVPTRLRALETQSLDAVVLACAGLARLGLAEHIDERIAIDVLLPAVAQGTLCLETRSGEALAEDLAALSDPIAASSAVAERAFLSRLEGDCSVPLAAFAETAGAAGWRVQGLVASEAGDRVVRGDATGDDPEATGRAAAESVLRAGGDAVLAGLAPRAQAGDA
jgi:hydroxymethylbilane synthase